LTLGRWRAERERGVITEMFGCNAVAGVVPITKVHDARQRPEGEADVWTVGKGRPGPVTTAISRALSDVQHGIAPAPRGWLHQIPADD
ncbi:MAG: branched chain amino acid aminotransferase, partial [Actinocrinis sp.]